ncbi:Gfo/Idh/MocA family protein [Conexibacter sp. CPCC 206217]|uniref:Gfo/Idh/MocA family protein n=1 Tax=Conexibacter sp. CPCC 206217 TaxID=3064574 RepID=UPI002725B27F|nr:Gfo/Idh/MocA family oxidoreductase [Conexibacter sp. CPCC 206217]MDO8209619.1 Gfo/Idh/MocA family oxidoreductase [Conexibacter sp. CPCC 206217]
MSAGGTQAALGADGPRASSRPIGWGLIGASAIAGKRMVAAIRSAPGATIEAVASGSLERARRFAAEHAVPRACATVDELLADPAIDAVYVSSTNDRHHDQVLAAAAAGKHVFCEKPLATNVAAGTEMVDACARAGVVLAVDQHLRCLPWIRRLRELVADGQLGQIQSISLAHRFAVDVAHDWRRTSGAGGGVILDLIVHEADLVRFLLDDEIVAVSAMTAHAPRSVAQTAAGTMATAGGTLVGFDATLTLDHAGTRLELLGTEAAAIASDGLSVAPGTRLSLWRRDVERLLATPPYEDPYAVGVAAFQAAIAGVGEPASSGLDGLRALAVAVAAREAARTGRTIRPPRLPHSARGIPTAEVRRR